jgi:cytochrome P450
LLSLSALIVSYTVYINWKFRKLPPGPLILPVFGTLLSLRGARIYHHAAEYARQPHCRGVVTHFVSGRPMVLFSDMKKIKYVFQDRSEHTSEHFTFPGQKINNPYRHGIIQSPGDRWVQMRRMSLHILKELGFGKNIVEQSIHEQCDHLDRYLHNHMNTPLDMSVILGGCTSDIISMLLFGKKPFMDNLVDEMKYVSYVQEFMRTNFRMLLFLPALAYLYKIPILNHYLPDNERLRIDREVCDYLRSEIKEHRKNFSATSDNPRDFVEHYLHRQATMNDKYDFNVLTDENLVFTLRDLFIAGTDTTSVTLCWLLALLSHRQDVQQKVYEELRAVIGGSPYPEMSHLNECAYTRAVISEALRYGVTAPNTLPHLASADILIDGYTIPKGSILFLNIYSLCRDPSLWEKPNEFYPEHFYDSTTNKFVACDNLLSFGMGRRACLGEGLARQETFVFLASMLRKFRFTFSKKQEYSEEEILSGHLVGLVRSPKCFFVQVELRD